MIPTVRSMIVAVALTMTVLVGGFGLFAAFRVNHEPLARLPVAATPFQLASIDSTPRALSFAPSPSRLESNEGVRAVETAMTPHEPERSDAVAAPAVAPTGDAADNAVPEHVATAAAQDSAATESPSVLSSPAAPSDAAAATPSPEAAPPQTVDVASAPAANPEAPQTTEAPPPPAETPQPKATLAAASPPETVQPESAPAVTESISETPPQEAAPPKVAALTPPAEPQETARQIANRKRLTVAHRIRRARIAARNQSTSEFTGFGQANFQSATGFQSAQSGFGRSSNTTPAKKIRRVN